MNDSNDSSKVVVTDFAIPFGSLVILLVKLALAAIPAIIILVMILVPVSFVLYGLVSSV